MNIFKIFSKNRQQLIESLEFSSFLYDISISLNIKYRKTNNRSIKFFLKLISWWRNWELKQIEDYSQLLFDYPYWNSRHYYYQRIEKFLSNELNIIDFISEVLYPSLSNKREGFDLVEDFQRQGSIKLDPKSFGFSTIISDLIPILEGFSENQEESFFTEQEFREIIKNAFIKLKKYPMD